MHSGWNWDRANLASHADNSCPAPQPLPRGLPGMAHPGLGHFYQGRTAKAILYAVCILSLYFLGFAMGEGKIVYWRWVNPMQ